MAIIIYHKNVIKKIKDNNCFKNIFVVLAALFIGYPWMIEYYEENSQKYF